MKRWEKRNTRRGEGGRKKVEGEQRRKRVHANGGEENKEVNWRREKRPEGEERRAIEGTKERKGGWI